MMIILIGTSDAKAHDANRKENFSRCLFISERQLAHDIIICFVYLQRTIANDLRFISLSIPGQTPAKDLHTSNTLTQIQP